jgi:hypothetical protein
VCGGGTPQILKDGNAQRIGRSLKTGGRNQVEPRQTPRHNEINEQHEQRGRSHQQQKHLTQKKPFWLGNRLGRYMIYSTICSITRFSIITHSNILNRSPFSLYNLRRRLCMSANYSLYF